MLSAVAVKHWSTNSTVPHPFSFYLSRFTPAVLPAPAAAAAWAWHGGLGVVDVVVGVQGSHVLRPWTLRVCDVALAACPQHAGSL